MTQTDDLAVRMPRPARRTAATLAGGVRGSYYARTARGELAGGAAGAGVDGEDCGRGRWERLIVRRGPRARACLSPESPPKLGQVSTGVRTARTIVEIHSSAH